MEFFKRFVYGLPAHNQFDSKYDKVLSNLIDSSFSMISKFIYNRHLNCKNFDFTNDDVIDILVGIFRRNNIEIDESFIQKALDNPKNYNNNYLGINLTSVFEEIIAFKFGFNYLAKEQKHHEEIEKIKDQVLICLDNAFAEFEKLPSFDKNKFDTNLLNFADIFKDILTFNIERQLSQNNIDVTLELIESLFDKFEYQDKTYDEFVKSIKEEIIKLSLIMVKHEDILSLMYKHLPPTQINFFISLPLPNSYQDKQIDKWVFDVLPNIVHRLMQTFSFSTEKNFNIATVTLIISEELQKTVSPNLDYIYMAQATFSLCNSSISYVNITKVIIKSINYYLILAANAKDTDSEGINSKFRELHDTIRNIAEKFKKDVLFSMFVAERGNDNDRRKVANVWKQVIKQKLVDLKLDILNDLELENIAYANSRDIKYINGSYNFDFYVHSTFVLLRTTLISKLTEQEIYNY